MMPIEAQCPEPKLDFLTGLRRLAWLFAQGGAWAIGFWIFFEIIRWSHVRP